MMAGGLPDKPMVPYLVGELSEADQEAFERACLDDDGLFEELLAVEAELTDDYVRGELVGARRTAFEKRLLNSPDGEKQIRLARLITQKVPSRVNFSAKAIPTGSPKWWSIAWLSFPRLIPVGAAAILVVAVSLGLLLWKKQNSSSGSVVQNAQLPASRSNASVSAPPVQANRALVIATFVIVGGAERDTGSVNEIKVPGGADRVQLRLDLAANHYSGYQASLQKIGGHATLGLDDVKATPSKAGPTLIIELPATDFPEGDSILTITGVSADHTRPEVVGKYFVRRSQ